MCAPRKLLIPLAIGGALAVATGGLSIGTTTAATKTAVTPATLFPQLSTQTSTLKSLSSALKLGLNEKDSQELVYQTFFGSIELLLKNNNSALKLAQNIAVTGGTTEAAFKIFLNKKILHKTFQRAINAAYKKSIKLSK